MPINQYLYTFRYDDTEAELSKLESKYIFDQQDRNKLLFSELKIEPSRSAFIKRRIDIISSSKDYSTLINDIKNLQISTEGFKVEYIVFDNDLTGYENRLEKLKDIGYIIDGAPDYYKPSISYALCFIEEIWYFGILHKNNVDWDKHKSKPRSFSNSLNINIAKVLVNIAVESNSNKSLIDVCCGAGTVMLEACYHNFRIVGCDINWKMCKNARVNLAHYNYESVVYCSDISNIDKRYDTAIIDLPYNLSSLATEDDMLNIINSTAKITDRMVIVSTTDISDWIANIGFNITDHCHVHKRGHRKFARQIWVCIKQS